MTILLYGASKRFCWSIWKFSYTKRTFFAKIL